MRSQSFFALVMMSAMWICASAFAPKTDTSCRWMRIIDIQPDDTTMRLTVRLQNRPGYWVNVPSSSRLVAVDDTLRQFKIIGSDNLPLDERIRMPESGYHEGVLVFEKVPQDIKVVDLVGESVEDTGNNILGVHLYEPASNVRPDMLTLRDVVAGDIPAEKWTGLAPKRYKNLAFYRKDGTTLLKGKITDYSPRSGITTFSVRTNNDFVGRDAVNVGDIAPDGTFGLEIPVSYPQRCYLTFGDVAKALYLIPGDTLEIATCMTLGDGRQPEYFGFTGACGDGAVATLLSDSLLDIRYGLEDMFRYALIQDSDSLKEATYRINAQLAQKLDSIITDLPVLLGDLPVSDFVKDLLSAEAIARVCETMEDLRMNFRERKGPRYVRGDDGVYSYADGDHLDAERLLAPVRKHLGLIFDDPLIVACGRILINRWEFGDVFRDLGIAARGLMRSPGDNISYISPDDVSLPMRTQMGKLDSIGLGNCFVADLMRNKGFIGHIGVDETPSYARLEAVGRLIPVIVKYNSYEAFNPLLMDSYNEFVKDVLIAENAVAADPSQSIIIEDSAGGNVLERIIAPYRGNVLFLDFWGLGCGPCRSGMLNQKPILKQLADQPFRALYIANMADGIEGCKKWLRKEEIKGEHIFVTQDDWNRLCGLFNFSGIPFGVLIGKDGKVIEKNFHLYLDNPRLKKALSM